MKQYYFREIIHLIIFIFLLSPDMHGQIMTVMNDREKEAARQLMIESNPGDFRLISAEDLSFVGTGSIVTDGTQPAIASIPSGFGDNIYDIVFVGYFKSGRKSKFSVWINDKRIGEFESPLSSISDSTGSFNVIWEKVPVKKGDIIKVVSSSATITGGHLNKEQWYGLVFATAGRGKELNIEKNVKTTSLQSKTGKDLLRFSDKENRLPDGDGTVNIEGELKQWHKTTIKLNGPFAHELDSNPNPFTDYNMIVTFRHKSGNPEYTVPGYFAADGDAGNTGADCGSIWKAHLSPDKTGEWHFSISFKKCPGDSGLTKGNFLPLPPFDGIKGIFTIKPNDKSLPDLRARGRLEYNGNRYLRFKGDSTWFLKAGTDSPETFLAYYGFDGTYTLNTPLKEFKAHISDWKAGDPLWKDGNGRGIIGAVNYLSRKGINSFSFLTYNAGGDGDNVWPFSVRDNKFSYDCSKLDQWQMVFDHAQSRGMHLLFKTQETENDDNTEGRDGVNSIKMESLDGGDMGPERRLYYRELIARFSYILALTWNLGEENSQTEAQRKEMAEYFKVNCPYPHNIVLHTYPETEAHDEIYTPLLGKNSELTGVSLQNDWKTIHQETLKWVKLSEQAGKPWVVANDEQGHASEGVPPDPGYPGFIPSDLTYTADDIRKQVLWANIMAGGAGVEYYFGYSLPENDLLCEDFRSRDTSWKYAAIALSFFRDQQIPFWNMNNRNELTGNSVNDKAKFCLAQDGSIYLVYLGYSGTTDIDLTGAKGTFSVQWFNPRKGGELLTGSKQKIRGGKIASIGFPPGEMGEDWLVIIKKQ